MSINTRHPSITADVQAEWRLMRDAMSGESAIKRAGEVYLPMPGGFKAMGGNAGVDAYEAYKARAQFPEITSPSVSAMIGIAHTQQAQIDLPSGMEYLLEAATPDGLTLDQLHRKITRELLVMGRYGVLADAPEGGGSPYLVGYTAESIINWDDDFFVLDECGMVRNGYTWERVEKYRVLAMVEGRLVHTVSEAGAEVAKPVIGAGGKAISRVPFAVASSGDLTPAIVPPPLIGVARPAKAIYQLSADYRWQLFMSGQETLVAINGTAPTAVGAGVVHSMMGAEGITPDLKYVSPTCNGIEAHKAAILECRNEAIAAGARLFDQAQSKQESGDARSLRYASETATLMSVVLSSCGLLERSLRNVAMLLGQDETAVVVTPPAELMKEVMTPAEAAALMGVWQGGGISYDTFYENIQRGGIASAERNADEELALIDKAQITDPSGSGDAVI
jgi:hypothetical protein